MTNIRTITRFLLALFSSFASISLLAVIIYLLSDYERNIVLNSNVDDFTLGFMIIMLVLFTGISILLFNNVLKRVKIKNNQ